MLGSCLTLTVFVCMISLLTLLDAADVLSVKSRAPSVSCDVHCDASRPINRVKFCLQPSQLAHRDNADSKERSWKCLHPTSPSSDPFSTANRALFRTFGSGGRCLKCWSLKECAGRLRDHLLRRSSGWSSSPLLINPTYILWLQTDKQSSAVSSLNPVHGALL